MSVNVGKGWMEGFCVTIRSIDLGPGTFSFGIIAVFAKMDNIIKGFRLYAGLLICLDLITLGMTETMSHFSLRLLESFSA